MAERNLGDDHQQCLKKLSKKEGAGVGGSERKLTSASSLNWYPKAEKNLPCDHAQGEEKEKSHISELGDFDKYP